MKKLLIFFTLIFGLLASAQDQKKIALIIGNANYEDPNGVLTNPINDSKLMSETFKFLEFDSVIVANDLNYESMRTAFSSYKRELRNNFDVGFIYYSGHGTQDSYKNSYLIPIDFPSNPTIDDVEEKAYNFQGFLKTLERMEDKLSVVVLDACRNNPFEKGWKGKSISGTGLAKPEELDGVLVHFSTTAGYVANDNSDQENSLYTETLSKVMREPNQKIEDIFKKTRKIVREESKKRGSMQSPTLYGEFEGDLYLLLKEDYSKIEIKTLQKNAESEKEKGNIKAAIDKYTILEIYLKGNMQNIDKQRLIKVYLDMGQIYHQMSDYDFPESEPAKFYEENKENWDDSYLEEYYDMHDKYLAKSSNAFLNAKLLLENESIDTKESIEHYSEAFYKYLRCQSYLDYADRGIDKDTFIKYINQLIDFNEKSFGNSDYRTASCYYLSGIFQHEFEPIIAYQHLVKSSEIFTRSKYTNEDLEGYALTLNPVYPYIWSIKSFNAILNFAFEDAYVDLEKAKNIISVLRESIDESMESLYRRNVQIINDGIETSKKHDNSNMEGMLDVAEDFYHTFPITISMYDNETGIPNYVECSHAAVKHRNLGLLYNNNHNDSILAFINNAQTYSNLSLVIDSTDSDSLQKIDEIVYNLRKDAFDIAIHHKNYVFSTFNSFLTDYYFKRTNPLYNKEEFKNRFSKVDKLFSNLMMTYRSQEDQSSWNKGLNRYILVMSHLINENVVDGEDEILKFTEHNIKRVMNDKEEGYGHYNMVEAYNYKANECLKFNKIEGAKRMYLDILDHIDNNKSDWTLSESDTEDFTDINQVILVKYSYGFGNYLLSMTDYHEGDYSENDSILITRCEDFLEKESKSLLETNIFWIMRLKLLKAKIHYGWSGEYKEDVLTYCDEALSILDQINKNEKMRSAIGWSDNSQFDIESDIADFYDLKLRYIESHKPKDDMLVTVNNKLISIAKKWKEYEKIFPIMDAKSNIVWYYYRTSNYSKYKSSSLEAFNIGERFLKQDDFSFFKTPKDAKLLLLMETGRFLVHATELVSKPKEVDRLKCIDFYKSIEKYIEENYDSVQVSSDSYGFPKLRQVYYTLADQFYFLDNYEKSMQYHIKDLELTKQISNNTISKKEEIKVLGQIFGVSEETGNDSVSLYYYTDYINKIDRLDTSVNLSCNILTKDFSTCSIPFLCLKIITKKNVWPCIEFDVDKNSEISNGDKRYYIDKDKLVVEKITKIVSDVGGYINQGINLSGEVNDTASNIFFEKDQIISTDSYFIQKKLKNNTKDVEWQFYIPLSELNLTEEDTEVNTLINYITVNEANFLLSRRYNKDTYPLKAKFTGFKNTCQIQITD